MGDKSNLIINEYIRPDSIPKFVRINNDTVVNTSHIVSINREWINSYAYSTYMEQYSDLMKKATDEYIKQHPEVLMTDDSESEIADLMYQKFDVYVKKQLEQDYGTIPEPWDVIYKIKMIDDSEFSVQTEIYYQIMRVIGINMDDDTQLTN